MTTELIPQIVKRYLEINKLSMRSFAEVLEVSHAAVSNWAAGKSIPDILSMTQIYETSEGIAHNFACEILAVLIPGWSNGNGNQAPSPCEDNHDDHK